MSRAAAKPLAPNPLWQYSAPRRVRIRRDPCDRNSPLIEVVEVDAMQLPMVVEYYAAVDAVNAKRLSR